MLKPTKLTLAAATVALTASAPSAAYAKFDVGPSAPSATSPAQQAIVPAVGRTTASSAEGFAWDDAGIGAAGVLVLFGFGSGAVTLRRRRTRQPLTG